MTPTSDAGTAKGGGTLAKGFRCATTVKIVILGALLMLGTPSVGRCSEDGLVVEPDDDKTIELGDDAGKHHESSGGLTVTPDDNDNNDDDTIELGE